VTKEEDENTVSSECKISVSTVK